MHDDSRRAAAEIPTFPRPAALALAVLPLLPVSLALTAMTRALAEGHPRLLRRLGDHASRRFIVDPTDLPLVLVLDLAGPRREVTATRDAPAADCRIAGRLAALLGLVHGAYDGDALFFSRDLVVEGDTAAALALRNAIDDAELDLLGEIADRIGPLATPLRGFADLIERATGVALTRRDARA